MQNTRLSEYSLCSFTACAMSVSAVCVFLWMGTCCAVKGGCMNEWRGWRDVCQWRGGEWRLRHITFPQCIEGTGLSVTHTVRMGREEVMGRRKQEREGETEKGRGRRREEEDEGEREGKEESGIFWSYLSFFHHSIPHKWCNTGDLFITARKPSSSSSPLVFNSPPPPSILAQLTAWMHEWTGLCVYCGGWVGGRWDRKPWGRQRGRQKRVSDREERGRMRESFHGIWTDTHWLLISSFTCEALPIISVCIWAYVVCVFKVQHIHPPPHPSTHPSTHSSIFC